MRIQERTYSRILENLDAVRRMFSRASAEYGNTDFKRISEETGISVSRVKRAYENLSEFGCVNLSLGDLANAVVVPDQPTITRRVTRRNQANTYIKRKDDGYITSAKGILLDRIFTNLKVQEIADKWNCSKGRVGSLVSEISRYGAIKLPRFEKHVLIDVTKYRGVDLKNTINSIKKGTSFSDSLERNLRHTLLTRVLRKELQTNE
jgi:DNA replication protein DnaD